MNSETINALYFCPVSTKEPDFDLSACPGSVTVRSVSPVSLNESVFELSVLPVSVTKLSASVSVNAPDFELSVSPVTVNEPDYELFARSVVIREITDELVVFPALALGAINTLSVSCVSVFPRSQFLPWSSVPSALSAPPWWSSVWLRWSSAPPWWSSVWLWWSSAPPWWAPVPPAPPWWAPVLSVPPRWAQVESALPWWAPATPAPPWWAPVPPRSSAPPWCSALPSLPLFRLRSTTLLDCIVRSVWKPLFGVGGLCHESSM